VRDTPPLNSSEGKILFVGLTGVVFYLAALLFVWLFYSDFYQAFAGMTFGNILFGRAAGITIGYAAGLETLLVVGVNFLVELLTVLVMYPLFNRFVERYHDKIHQYGLYGLFAFVWFPFWMTGPAVGAMIGYVMGLRHRVTLSVVLSGTLLAIFGWAWFLNILQEWAKSIDPRAPWLIVGLIVLLVLIGFLLRKFRKQEE